MQPQKAAREDIRRLQWLRHNTENREESQGATRRQTVKESIFQGLLLEHACADSLILDW